MFREPHQFVQRVVDDEQALAVEDNPHIAAAGAGYFLLCKTAVFDAAGHIVRLKEQAVAEKITGKESIALICCAKHVAKRDAVLCCWNEDVYKRQVFVQIIEFDEFSAKIRLFNRKF